MNIFKNKIPIEDVIEMQRRLYKEIESLHIEANFWRYNNNPNLAEQIINRFVLPDMKGYAKKWLGEFVKEHFEQPHKPRDRHE